MSEHISIKSACLHGIEVVPVEVEVDISGGIPGIAIIGMPDAAVLDARSRVRCALRASGFSLPRQQVTVNLAPGNVRKTGSGFDLPIAVGILAATGQIPIEELEHTLFVGELGLSGDVCETRGMLAYEWYARTNHLKFVGGALVKSKSERPSNSLASSSYESLSPHLPSSYNKASFLHCLKELAGGIASLSSYQARSQKRETTTSLDFSDVVDQEVAKRALVIAAAGGHGLLMVGPPGAGKSMLAKRFVSIMEPLTEQEAIEAALIYSVAGVGQNFLGKRPFAAPHHSITIAGLIGGGHPVIPGQVSLAHHGVLFLDELPEFNVQALQSLRQPMEEGVVHIVRASGSYTMPAQFQLIAAANPCPCGHLGDKDVECTCPDYMVKRYQAKIGGPIMDRIAMMVDVWRPAAKNIIEGSAGSSTQTLRAQVAKAHAFKRAREKKVDAAASSFKERLGFNEDALELLGRAAQNFFLGGRAISRIAQVARTIADLDESSAVIPAHIQEALIFRSRATLETNK